MTRATSRRQWGAWRWAGPVLALALTLVLLDIGGILRPLPSSSTVRERLRANWASVRAYSAQVIVTNGRGTPTGRASLRWERDGRLGASGPDYGGFLHHQLLAGDLRTYYQPGAEIVGETLIRGLGETPYGSWMVLGYPGIHEVVQALNEAQEVSVRGVSEVSGQRALIVSAVPRMPLGVGRGTQDAELYRSRLGVPWTVHLSRVSYLPLQVQAASGDASAGWGVKFQDLSINPSFAAQEWDLTSRKLVRRIRLTASATDLATVVSAQAKLDRVINRWKGRMMTGALGRGSQRSGLRF